MKLRHSIIRAGKKEKKKEKKRKKKRRKKKRNERGIKKKNCVSKKEDRVGNAKIKPTGTHGNWPFVSHALMPLFPPSLPTLCFEQNLPDVP